eukprot:TRINITY_DN1659_c0_g2_i2.p1 TRINITY_DN1659_c0_g2~~TRINITY_DN1659_c0_g2_i2.p1  ORF type:complete len:551 (+),score=76.77 TRINITY_DN1659_c0_g2_i2:41-1654(+)
MEREVFEREVFAALPRDATRFQSGTKRPGFPTTAAVAKKNASMVEVAFRYDVFDGPPQFVCWLTTTVSSTDIVKHATSLRRVAAADVVDVSATAATVRVQLQDFPCTLYWLAYATQADATATRSALRQVMSSPPGLSKQLKDVLLPLLTKDANSADDMGQTLLHASCHAGNVQLIKWLVTKWRTQVDRVDSNGWTPFLVAVAASQLEAASVMLDLGASPTYTETSSTALHELCRSGAAPFSKLEQLIRRVVAASPPLLNARNSTGGTPLYVSCRQTTRSDIPKLMLTLGADCNIGDCNGYTPLHCASFQGNCEVAGMLIDAGADPNALSRWGSVWDVAKSKNNVDVMVLLQHCTKMQELPAEVLLLIAHHMDTRSIYRMRCVCAYFRRVADSIIADPAFWRARGCTFEDFEVGMRFGHKMRSMALLADDSPAMHEWLDRPLQHREGEQYIKIGLVGFGVSTLKQTFAYHKWSETKPTMGRVADVVHVRWHGKQLHLVVCNVARHAGTAGYHKLCHGTKALIITCALQQQQMLLFHSI